MTKHDGGESVSDNELEDTGENQKQASEEDENSAVSSQPRSCMPLATGYLRECSTLSTSSSPSHQTTRQRRGREDEAPQAPIAMSSVRETHARGG